jgi:anaerobic sulfatase-maturating enzyme
MTPAVLETYVRDYIAAQPGPVVSFGWQGGEPTLLGVEFFETAVALQQRYAHGKTVENAFQTNGVLLDDRWGEFLARHKFLVGLSLDGPAHLHDAYRVDRGGQPTFERVMAGLAVLKKHRVDFNTLTTVHRKNAPHALEVYRFLREVGSGYLQFIPIVERDAASTENGLWLAPPPDHEDAASLDSQVTPWSVRPMEFGEFLTRIFDEWVQRDIGRVYVQQFDAALANWSGAPAGVCVFSKDCGRALAVEHNGDVYSCDHYVYPRYKLGNLMNTALGELVDTAAAARLRLREIRHAPALLPRVPRAFRLSRRVSQTPLPQNSRRRPRPQLPLRRLQKILYAHRLAHAHDVRPARFRPSPGPPHAPPPRPVAPLAPHFPAPRLKSPQPRRPPAPLARLSAGRFRTTTNPSAAGVSWRR